MIVKYHNRGVGGGSGPVQYLLGKDYDREGSELLRGDPEDTIDLIDSLEFNKKYTSGVLSFTEKDLPEEVKNQIMDSFEHATFCGMDKDQYSILWVQHKDKGNLELNYVIPNVELGTGKRFQPYYDRADRHRINQFRDIQNMKYDLTNPLDRERKRSLSLNKDLPRDLDPKRDLKTQLEDMHKVFINGIAKGTINSREDIKTLLETSGVKVARETDKSISIENPNGRNIRLKGEIYERSFRSSKGYRAERTEAIKSFREGQGKGFKELNDAYNRSHRHKCQQHEKSYPKALESDIQPDLNSIREWSNSSSNDIASSLGNSPSPENQIKQGERGIKPDHGRERASQTLGNRTGTERPGQDIPGSSRRDESRNLEREHIHNGDRVNDRDRATITKSIEELRNRRNRSISSIKRGLSQSARGKQNPKKRRELFNQTGRAITNRVETIREIRQERAQSIQRSKQIKRSRNYDLGRDSGGWGW